MLAEHVAQHREAQGLVEDHPVLDPVAQGLTDDADVVRKHLDDVAVGPATLVLQGLWQIPVVQGDPGLDASAEARVDDAFVVVEPFLVHRVAIRLDARP